MEAADGVLLSPRPSPINAGINLDVVFIGTRNTDSQIT
jgi:hypothetical protein